MDITKNDKMSNIMSFDEETNTVYVEFPKGFFNLVVNGDFSLTLNGEINCTTKNDNICLDTIGGGIYLNSRWGKSIRNLPESVEYRKRFQNNNNNLYNELINRIESLEKEIRELRSEN
jgi:prefoldin subunit 5